MVPKKKRAAQQAPAPVRIKFECVSGSCVAKKKRTHMSPGNQVELRAVNRNVSLVFDLQSPFASGAGFPANNPIVIPSGTIHPAETVANGASGTFSYRITCTNPLCGSGIDNPEMVVP